MKQRIETRVGSLNDQIKDLQEQMIKYCKFFDSNYFEYLERIGKLKNERDVLRDIWNNKYANDLSSDEKVEVNKKFKSLKSKEMNKKLDIVGSFKIYDKLHLRRDIEGLLNDRTRLVKLFVQKKYGFYIDIEPLLIDLKIGQ